MDYTDTHRDIVEACLAGSRTAQFELYRLYSPAMYNICLRMLKHESDAEDLLQNAFVDVFGKLHYFRFESSIGAWIKRIVVNNCINFLKKRRLQLVDISERDLPAEADTAPDTPLSLSVAAIQAAMRDLPDGYRVVLDLYLFEGYDHQEIGDILGITASTSKSQYSRAKKKLKSLLADQGLHYAAG